MPVAIIFGGIGIYLLFGLVFAVVFVIKGADKVDESARDSTIGFKIIIIPGTMVFWPLLLNKWLKASKNRYHD